MKSFAASVLERIGANLDGLDQDSVNQEFRTTIAFLVDDFLEKQRSDSLPALPLPPKECPECEARKSEKLDTSTATKRIINWNGLKIGVTHGPDDVRFGQKLRTASYGRVYRSYGQAEDGKAVDTWVGPDVKIPEDDGEVENSTAFWMNQINPTDGSLDERKLVIGFRDRASAKEAIQSTMPAHLRDGMFGGLYDCTDDELESYRVQKIIQQDSSPEIDLMNLLTEGEPWRQQRVDYEGDDHRQQIIEALAANLPVPPYILLDYPDLAEKLATTPPENLWQYPNAIAVLDSLDIRNDGITSTGWVHWDDCGCSQCSLKRRKKKKPINPRPLEDIEEEVQKEEFAKNGFLGDSEELRTDKKCGNGHIADNKTCKSDGGKKDLWGVWHEGRRTSVIVDASNRSEAISEAEKKKKRGGKGIDAARLLNDKEKKAISGGRWLRTGPNGESAGYDKGKKGFGPKPKTDADELEEVESLPGKPEREDAYKNGNPQQRGLIKKQIQNKKGRRQTVWTRPENEGRSRQLQTRATFSSQQQLSGLRKSNFAVASGMNESFFVQGKPTDVEAYKKALGNLQVAESGYYDYRLSRPDPRKFPNEYTAYLKAGQNIQKALKEANQEVLASTESYFYKKGGSEMTPFDVRNEGLCSQIALSANIPHNEVRIAPSEVSAQFKKTGEVGTLHQIVKGETLASLESSNPAIHKRYGALTPLDRAISHPDLAKIYALDVFTGNPDRHSGNLMYDQSRDSFASIDMGQAFAVKRSANHSLKYLERKLQDGKLLSPMETQNLKTVGATLKKLRSQNPPESIKERADVLDRAIAGKTARESLGVGSNPLSRSTSDTQLSLAALQQSAKDSDALIRRIEEL